MKTIVLLPIFILCVMQTSQAQTDSTSMNTLYRTWIIPNDGSKGVSGILFEVKDSSVAVSNSPRKNDYYSGDYTVSEFDIKNIDVIQVRKQGNGLALLVGGVSGVAVGAVVSAIYTKSRGTVRFSLQKSEFSLKAARNNMKGIKRSWNNTLLIQILP